MIKFTEKAGMTGIDKEKITKIIDANTNPNYKAYSTKREEKTRAQIRANEEKLLRATVADREIVHRQMEAFKNECELSRDLSRDAVHVDMDAFYAAVECRDDPSLRSIPMAVGDNSMLSTSNYAARRFGVRAAMPGFIAKKLCPQLKIVPVNFRKYRAVSAVVQEVFRLFDPEMSMGSLDEAYLELTDHVRNRVQEVTLPRIRYYGPCICRLPRIDEEDSKEPDTKRARGETTSQERTEELCTKCGKNMFVITDSVTFGLGRWEAVRELRFRVEQATGLTCSAGIAPNHKLAKVCSDMNKPNGQFELKNDIEAVKEFLSTLPIRKISGIGRVSEEQLKALGIDFVKQLADRATDLALIFKPRTAEWFVRVGLGVQSPHFDAEEEDKRKSISVERTFQPTADPTFLREETMKNCQELYRHLPKAGIIGGKAVTLKVKWATFDVITRCRTVSKPLTTVHDIYEQASKLLAAELAAKNPMRLLGVKLSRLIFDGGGEEQATTPRAGKQQSLSQFFLRPSTSSVPRPPAITEEADDKSIVISDSDEEESEKVADAKEEQEEPKPGPSGVTIDETKEEEEREKTPPPPLPRSVFDSPWAKDSDSVTARVIKMALHPKKKLTKEEQQQALIFQERDLEKARTLAQIVALIRGNREKPQPQPQLKTKLPPACETPSPKPTPKPPPPKPAPRPPPPARAFQRPPPHPVIQKVLGNADPYKYQRKQNMELPKGRIKLPRLKGPTRGEPLTPEEWLAKLDKYSVTPGVKPGTPRWNLKERLFADLEEAKKWETKRREKKILIDETDAEPRPGPSGFNQEMEEGHVACPVCGVKLKDDQRTVNIHLDECLNQEVIKEIAGPSITVLPKPKTETKEPVNKFHNMLIKMKKPTTLPDFFRANKRKKRKALLKKITPPRTEMDKYLDMVRLPLPPNALKDPKTGREVTIHNPYDFERWRHPEKFQPRDPINPPK